MQENMISTWFINAGLAIICALVPAHTLLQDIVLFTIIKGKQDLPSWIIKISRIGDIGKIKQYTLLNIDYYNTRHNRNMMEVAVWIIVCLAINQGIILVRYLNVDRLSLLIHEISFPPIFLLSVILPRLLFRHYIRNKTRHDTPTIRK
jgi:hypothetical protein